jgi:hypothetical protein
MSGFNRLFQQLKVLDISFRVQPLVGVSPFGNNDVAPPIPDSNQEPGQSGVLGGIINRENNFDLTPGKICFDNVK